MKGPRTVHRSERHSVVVDNRRTSIRAGQDRFRDPGLPVLLILQLCLVFLGAPLAAKGLPVARPIIETMVFAVVVIVVMLSHRHGAIAAILSGLAAILASILLGSELSPFTVSVLRHGGNILTLSALTWVLSHVVYADGRITFHRLQGAGVLYLNRATISPSAFSDICWDRHTIKARNLDRRVLEAGPLGEIGPEIRGDESRGCLTGAAPRQPRPFSLASTAGDG